MVAIDLDPIDQDILEITGELPKLSLFVPPLAVDPQQSGTPSVHTLETSPSFSRRWSYRAILLQHRMPHYKRAVEIYTELDGSFGGKLTSRLTSCRTQAWFVQHVTTGELRVASSRCKLRWCPICRDVSRNIVTHAVMDWLQCQRYPKMLTLTLKHNDDPLDEQVQRIYDCFRKFRTRAFFKRNVTGGVWFFQLKLNQQTQQWHPHIHCLVAGNYLAHTKLKTLWRKVTGDSTVVDIRPVKDRGNASSEVARYATSPADLTAMSFEKAMDLFYATKDRRICGTWGTARGLRLSPRPQDDHGDWQKVADFLFVSMRKEHDPDCKEFWKSYMQGTPYLGSPVQEDCDLYADEISVMLEHDKPPPLWFNLQWKVESTGPSSYLLPFYPED